MELKVSNQVAEQVNPLGHESPGTGEIRIDVIVYAPREREDLRVNEAAGPVRMSSETPGMQGLGQRVLEADAPVRIGGGREFLFRRFADDGHDEAGDRAVDALDVAGLDPVAGSQSKQRVDVGVQDVCRWKGLER